MGKRKKPAKRKVPKNKENNAKKKEEEKPQDEIFENTDLLYEVSLLRKCDESFKRANILFMKKLSLGNKINRDL